MGSARFLRIVCAAAALVVAPWSAHAQGFAADYDIARFSSPETQPLVKLAPAHALGGDFPGAGLSLQAGRNWFGQVGLAQGPVSALTPASAHDIVNMAGGYRWGNGQSLSLQLSRGRGPGQRLGLALNYDWPHYFVRFSYDQGLSLAPQDSLRFSAGVRF
jgi:hypothetical protein